MKTILNLDSNIFLRTPNEPGIIVEESYRISGKRLRIFGFREVLLIGSKISTDSVGLFERMTYKLKHNLSLSIFAQTLLKQKSGILFQFFGQLLNIIFDSINKIHPVGFTCTLSTTVDWIMNTRKF